LHLVEFTSPAGNVYHIERHWVNLSKSDFGNAIPINWEYPFVKREERNFSGKWEMGKKWKIQTVILEI
jgi:hypothetical protein